MVILDFARSNFLELLFEHRSVNLNFFHTNLRLNTGHRISTFKNFFSARFFRIPCALKGPFVNLVLLRTHRTGSGTLANILYRYGDLNDLDFALPKQKSYDFYWPLHFNPSYVDKKYLNSTAPNLLINARYSPDTIASFMPKVTNTCLIQTQIIMQPLGNSGDRGWLLYAPLCIP